MKKILFIYMMFLFSSCSFIRHTEKQTIEQKKDSIEHISTVSNVVNTTHDNSTIETIQPGDTANATLPSNQGTIAITSQQGTTIVAYKDSIGNTHIKVVTPPKHIIQKNDITSSTTSNTTIKKDTEVKTNDKTVIKNTTTKHTGISKWFWLLLIIPVGFIVWKYWIRIVRFLK